VASEKDIAKVQQHVGGGESTVTTGQAPSARASFLRKSVRRRLKAQAKRVALKSLYGTEVSEDEHCKEAGAGNVSHPLFERYLAAAKKEYLERQAHSGSRESTVTTNQAPSARAHLKSETTRERLRREWDAGQAWQSQIGTRKPSGGQDEHRRTGATRQIEQVFPTRFFAALEKEIPPTRRHRGSGESIPTWSETLSYARRNPKEFPGVGKRNGLSAPEWDLPRSQKQDEAPGAVHVQDEHGRAAAQRPPQTSDLATILDRPPNHKASSSASSQEDASSSFEDMKKMIDMMKKLGFPISADIQHAMERARERLDEAKRDESTDRFETLPASELDIETLPASGSDLGRIPSFKPTSYDESRFVSATGNEKRSLISRAGLDVLLSEWKNKWEPNLDNSMGTKDLDKIHEKSKIPVTEESIQPILDFLREDRVHSHNLIRFSNWLRRRHLTEDAVQAFLTVVLEMRPTLIGRSGVKFSRVVLNLLDCEPLDSVIAPLVSFLNSLRRGDTFYAILGSVVESICVQELGGKRMGSMPQKIKAWLHVLKSIRDMTRWDGQRRVLLKRTNDLSILSELFSDKSNSAIAWLLLQEWVFPRLAATWPTPRVAKDYEQSRSSPFLSSVTINKTQEELCEELQKVYEASALKPGKFDMLVELLVLLHVNVSHKFAVDTMAREILGLLTCLRTPSELKVFYDRIRDHPLLETYPKFRRTLIEHYIRIGESYYAWHVFNHSPALFLDHTCYELPLLMIDKGEIGSAAIMEMLTGKHSGVKEHNTRIQHAPPAFGQVIHPKKAPTPERKQSLIELVDLVHLMALAWAESPHVTDRESFRRVWECYRFLVNRGIRPRTPIIRALVTASLLRTFRRTGRGLVLTKAQYIINLIRRGEGDAEAVLFEQKLQALLAESAVPQEILLKQLAKEAWNSAIKALDPAVAALDARRRAQRAPQKVLLNHRPHFQGLEHDKRGAPRSLVKLPDGSYLHEYDAEGKKFPSSPEAQDRTNAIPRVEEQADENQTSPNSQSLPADDDDNAPPPLPVPELKFRRVEYAMDPSVEEAKIKRAALKARVRADDLTFGYGE
jgi:hypothetical protein